MIDDVIRPGLINHRDACHVNTFMQLLFYILPLVLLIIVSPNRDLIIYALHLMFVAMSQDWFIDAVSLSTVSLLTVCEPGAFNVKDCFKLGLRILGALHNASSGTLRDIIQQLFCSRPITRFSAHSSPRRVSGRR
jgi:hypothetical protein